MVIELGQPVRAICSGTACRSPGAFLSARFIRRCLLDYWAACTCQPRAAQYVRVDTSACQVSDSDASFTRLELARQEIHLLFPLAGQTALSHPEELLDC